MDKAVARPGDEFIGLDEETDFRPLARALGTVVDIAANEVIFREGDPSPYMYVVLKGEVEVSAERRILETVHEGGALGILSLLDGSPRSITARAVEPCELALLDEKRFGAMVEQEPNFIWFVMEELGSQPRAATAL